MFGGNRDSQTFQKQWKNFINLLSISSKNFEILSNKEAFNILDEMIKEGLIQRFEYTHELAWNVMKDYSEYQGNSTIGGSRDA